MNEAILEKDGMHCANCALAMEKAAGEAEDETVLKVKRARGRMWVAWGLSVPIISLMVFEMFFGIVRSSSFTHHFAMIVFALPVLLWSGWPT